ncbi:hypothetical protein GCM10027289_11850 [Tsukamurella serpentis]
MESAPVRQVRAVIASVLGSLRGGPHLPGSGLHWAAAYLFRDDSALLVLTGSDAGWLPAGTVVPAGVRVLWSEPEAAAWAPVDDPVRQLVEFAGAHGYSIGAVASTHPSRAHHIPKGRWQLVGEHHLGPVLPGSVSRFEVVASPDRVRRVRSLPPDGALRQCRALVRDLERVTVEPRHAIGDPQTRVQIRRRLAAGRVPRAATERLRLELGDVEEALRLPRANPRSAFPAGAPDGAALRAHLLERAIMETALAAAGGDVESAVYCWTVARHLV